MRHVRSMLPLGLFLLTAAMVPASCATDAVGVDECRRIEYARCEAAVHCLETFDFDDVEGCKRFYRDQCLHGLDLSKTPDKSDVTACVDVIDELASCAARDGEDALVVDCASLTSTVSKVDRVCELIRRPEASPECRFIVDDGEGGEGGAGGAGGEGGEGGDSRGGAGGGT